MGGECPAAREILRHTDEEMHVQLDADSTGEKTKGNCSSIVKGIEPIYRII